MTGPRARAIAASLAIATLAAACTGSDQPEVQPPLESAEPLTSLPPTTEAPATTVTESTVAPDSTTTTIIDTTTTSTTTEPAPSTTTLEDLRAEIEADLNAGERAFLRAGADPSSEERRAELARYEGGSTLAGTFAYLDTLVDDGLVIEPGSDPESSIVVFEVVEAAGGAATVSSCRIDASVIREQSDQETPGEIVNDTVIRYTSRTELEFNGDSWRIVGGESLKQEEGETTCDA